LEQEIRKLALKTGRQQIPSFIDYFCFHKGLYQEIPALVVGRNYWDHWLVWRALTLPVPMIDCSRGVIAVYQNHDYAYSPGGSAVEAQGRTGTNLRCATGKLVGMENSCAPSETQRTSSRVAEE
jgi:hypothetical protein